ncbi:aldehyde-activating protein [Aquamicrobium defluvii]|nr:aldehyde-activating protein [Aquamicrobium defluvii]EZQ13685.1 aldehyde-activating protein [Halopseudomonas bauzanensis]
MCQKAFGAFYAPLVSVSPEKLEWTRGEPKRFRSSNLVLRGFCGECGTPLTYEAPDGIALAIGAFDSPAEIAPVIQWGIENKLPYVDSVHRLPGKDTMADEEAASFLVRIVSHQHPDHDTDTWPQKDSTS